MTFMSASCISRIRHCPCGLFATRSQLKSKSLSLLGIKGRRDFSTLSFGANNKSQFLNSPQSGNVAKMAEMKRSVRIQSFAGEMGGGQVNRFLQQQSSINTWANEQTSQSQVDASDPVGLAKTIFCQGLRNVLPSKLITSHIKLQGTLLTLENEENTTIDLSHYNKKYVVGFGKACLPMAETLLPVMNGLIDRCIVSIPKGSRACINSDVEVHTGAENNIPDEDAFAAARNIVELVQACTPDDLLIVLISGGGSALLPYPKPPVTLEEKKNLIRSLSRAGCSIQELNTVRKRISLVKGGGLVTMCRAKNIISLIISDVTGSPLDTIASGPTVPNYDDSDAAYRIIQKYGMDEDCPQSVLSVLKAPAPSMNLRDFDRVTNLIIGNNQLALEAASAAASKLGLHPFIVTNQLTGDASEVGYAMATLTQAFAYFLNFPNPSDDLTRKPHMETILKIFKQRKWPASGIIPEVLEENSRHSIGICLLFGGETTVKVKGSGTGGRNQEMVLSAGIKLDTHRNLPSVKDKVAILSAGTDGFDGPNSAAGAVVEASTMHKAQLEGLSPLEFLRDNDSFNFFRQVSCGKYHIVSGHTETNVMDISIIVILKKDAQKRAERRKSML